MNSFGSSLSRRTLRSIGDESFSVEDLIIGESAPIQRLRSLVLRLAPAGVPVLIQGPTGSGKELVARALHAAAHRKGTLVSFNVCAISEAMFEDALFGHVRGAFTGACSDSAGYLTEAHEGTMFLDEISGLPLPLQAKLLRVLENGEFRPVGGRLNRRSSFRLVSATNENLSELVEGGLFRADLLFRIRGGVINVPSLKERIEDIRTLARHFAAKVASHANTRYELTAGALSRLERHTWPGNVRELQHTIEFACTIAVHGPVDTAHILAALDGGVAAARRPRELSEPGRALRVLLEENEWNTALVARRLGVSRKTVYERIRRFGIVFPQKHQRRQAPSGQCDASRSEPEMTG